ncbi:acyl-CoA dehydrogenase family protein [Novosphingobium sp. JCM 18896]|uniref:acyl-CoA dehydrogenase family protein n=1 Tax=Novosphingobium sp. JCM 18896 TaxID=2989731 RepID=UPI002222E51F|nr:acyl-CoA dehydrogenase family protein [Novosphingobium sp. JCM 18896]MCW1432376.1 acyl-CoA dehydrogenase family protein [Novosphingobium sp. JCM 18896]
MNFEHSEKVAQLVTELAAFMDEHIYPAEGEVREWTAAEANRWKVWPGMAALKEKARAQGLWNLFLPLEYGELSPGLTNLEYAPLAELMGRVPWAAEVFNCSPPDTGNMEVLAKFGTEQQKREWLTDLLEGKTRSAYLMTEPAVASSDATNVETSIRRDGPDYVINGRKWWISGIMEPECKLLLVMGKTDPESPRHLQQSTIIVPRDSPGVTIVRNLRTFNSWHSPGGEAEVLLEDVRVPAENIVLGEGRGFEIAQGRLGPGRIHHCMRSIGQAQRALELMCVRAANRVAFGRKLSDQGSIRQDIARSFIEIEQARLLTLKAADAMDRVGSKGALDLIAAIKIVAPQMAQTVADRAMQIHGAMGFCDDTPLAETFLINRFLRMADGPDEVHLNQLGRLKLKEYNA